VLTTEYRNGAFHRGIIAAPDATTPPRYANGRLFFDIALIQLKHGTLASTLLPWSMVKFLNLNIPALPLM